MFQQILVNLRRRVQQLEEDELYEEMLSRSQGILEQQQPASRDVDTIMQEMLNASPGPVRPHDGPWLRGFLPYDSANRAAAATPASGTTAGRKGKGKGW